MAEDIWTIVGLSSLVSIIVTVILGLMRDVIFERYRFNRQQEADHLKNQIQVLSRIHFLLVRLQKGATDLRFFKEPEFNVKELNDLIEGNSSLLTQDIFNDWMDIWVLVRQSELEKDSHKQSVARGTYAFKIDLLIIEIESYHNNVLLPKYRSFVGDTIMPLSSKTVK